MNPHGICTLIKLPWRRRRVSRAQALVEFALILPLLALFLVMAVDFGRVFFGWVGVQNIARIGANFAAIHPEAFNPLTPNSPIKQQLIDQYNHEIVNDVGNLNCAPRPTLTPTPTNIPQPSYTDVNGNGTRYDMGDTVTVYVTCRFTLITPLANNFFGGGVNIGAASTFTLRSGAIAGIPTPGGTASPSATPSGSATPTPSPSSSPCPLPIANFAANPTQGDAPLTVVFNDTSQTFGCAVTGWQWDFGDGFTSTLQNPTHTYTNKGQYDVTLTVTSPGGSNSTNQNNYIHAK
jgi:hypothetical protein